ncbi:hypothetical protein MCAP1_001729 [Malassezia caprae]|uniref:Nucleoporin n=1 Tax=Malassezia caprae TaxID=1381934 RepID=A0AAF0E4T0_9BASI|nr:hypothetical protein MCAP1_001729 [Malassezia caprae]
MSDTGVLQRLGDAQKVIAKWCQPRALALPDIKARLPPRDAPYEEHSQPDDAWAGFRVQRRLPIPSMVFETITSRAPVATLALFPEIGRACITVDHRLYLWDYAHGHNSFEHHELPSDELILSVGLVRARPGVFIDAIQHVLVLSTGPTATEGRRVLLLGVEMVKAPSDEAAGIKLYETAMSASTNGVAMRNIQGTEGGRVFCLGSDHCVHELVYQAQESWFRSRCYMYNVTQPHLANLVPSFFRHEKRIRLITVDSARQLLYVLRDGDQIDVYSLPSRDASRAPVHTGSMYGVARQAGLLHSQQEVGPIVWLGATEPDTRSSVCLVAVTERGYRIYLDDFQRRSWAQLAVRAPPGAAPAHRAQGPPVLPLLAGAPGTAPAAPAQRATGALYARGVFLCAMSTNDMGSVLYAVGAPVPAANTTLTYAAGVGAAWQEGATRVPLGTGASAPVLAEALPAPPADASGATLRPCVAQTTSPARVFFVLDSNGLTELVERRPADVLASLLGSAAATGAVSTAPPIVDFFSRYGPVEACLCALALAARNAHVVPHERDEVAQAIRVFFGPLGAWPAEQRVPGLGGGSRSARYEALACYMACVLRSVWTEPLVPADFWRAGARATSPPLVARGALAAVLADLTPLHAFLQRHSQLMDDERTDVGQLQALAQRTMEACQFVLFLADHNMRAMGDALPAETRTRLTQLSLADLVTTADGRRVANDLVTALIESQSGARASVDAMAEALQARCAGFCSADDVRQYKASECLRNATELDRRLRAEEGAPSGAAPRRAAVDEQLSASLHLLLPSAAQLPLEKLEHVCATYQQLRYVRGVVSLALACARASDPADTAVAFRADGCPGDELASPRQSAYALRRRMYALVLQALQVLKDEAAPSYDEALALATQSDDALFHEELYTALVAAQRTDELLALHTPFLADFLQGTPVLLGGEPLDVYERRLRDLLWQWYVRQGDCLAAAETLDALAHTESYALRLHERIEYLALAVGNVKSVRPSAATHVPDLVAFATQLEEDLEVAQVQAKVLSALPSVDAAEWEPVERERLAQAAQELDMALLDMTTLYKELAEPLGLLEEQLLIIHTAQYQDAELVARIWEALLAREHNASAPAQAHQAVAALVTDVYVRLGGSETACPLELVLGLLERYAYDTECAVQGEAPAPSALEWHAFRTLSRDAPLLRVGWAPLVLLEAGAPADTLFSVMQGLLSKAPAPWNTTSGVGFLLPDLIELAETWVRQVEQSVRPMAFPAHQVDQVLNDAVLQLHTRRYVRAHDALDRRLEQVQALVQRVRRPL